MMRNLLTGVPGGMRFGGPLIGLPASQVEARSLFGGVAARYPGRLIRGLILFQNGFVFFQEDGTYIDPPGPVVVLWALYVDGEFVENLQSLIGADASDYPATLPIDADSRFVPRPSIERDVMVSGRQRGRALFARDQHDITLYHHHVGEAERALLMAHFLGNGSREFDLFLLSGETYRCRYTAAPGEVPRPGLRWTLVSRLYGYLVAGEGAPVEGPWPELAYDASSTFESRGGIRADYAWDGVLRSRRGYAEVIWDLVLVYPGIRTADRAALLGHYLRYRLETFEWADHAGQGYLLQWVERPFSIRHDADLWTVTARLTGVRA